MLRGVQQLQVQVVLQIVRESDAGMVVPLRAGQPLNVLQVIDTRSVGLRAKCGLCKSACIHHAESEDRLVLQRL